MRPGTAISVRGGVRTAYEQALIDVEELGLKDYVAELEVQGYTVVPPELMITEEKRHILLEGVLDWAEKCHGERPDIHSDEVTPFQQSDFGDSMPTILGAGPIFEEMLLHPVVMAFATWLTGFSTTLDYYAPAIKGRGGKELELHTDAQLIMQAPGPLPAYSVAANCTLTLTDFTRENGCTVMIPGSHRRNLWGKGAIATEPTAVAVECPAGSLIVWHGNTWHGALPRTATGKRVSLLMYFTRHWLRSREDWAGHIEPDVLARNPDRLATLLGVGLPFGYHSYDEFLDKVVRGARPRTILGRDAELSLWS